MFQYYVLNYNVNKRKVENFNIFDNVIVRDRTLREIKKYLRSSKKYKTENFRTKQILYGYEALCYEINRIIMCEEWCRSEYEISVGYAFEDNCEKLEKWDCYSQADPNIEAIVDYCIKKYKESKKNAKISE